MNEIETKFNSIMDVIDGNDKAMTQRVDELEEKINSILDMIAAL